VSLWSVAPVLILEGLSQYDSPSFKAGSHLLQSVRFPVVFRLGVSTGKIEGPRVSQIKLIRTCRIDTILKHGLDFVKDLGLRNAKDLAKLIQVGHASLCYATNRALR
jgi:hypothetical protein